MEKILIVVDMQKDFIDGSLGTPEAQAIVENVVKKINEFDGSIYVTYDTHTPDYMNTAEGMKLPVEHCTEGTDGWELNDDVKKALENKNYIEIKKPTFGSVDLPQIIESNHNTDNMEIELIGVCTDICVISNALLLKASFPEMEISVDKTCCAGVTPQKHNSAIDIMQSCQINV